MVRKNVCENGREGASHREPGREFINFLRNMQMLDSTHKEIKALNSSMTTCLTLFFRRRPNHQLDCIGYRNICEEVLRIETEEACIRGNFRSFRVLASTDEFLMVQREVNPE